MTSDPSRKETITRAKANEYTQLLAYIKVSKNLNDWISGARIFALLYGAVESGVIDALQKKSTPEQIATTTHMNLESLGDLLTALEEHGVVMRDGGRYELTADFAQINLPNAAIPLKYLVGQAGVMIRTLQMVSPSDDTYNTLPPEDILAMAGGAGISALSTSPHVSQEATGMMLPEADTLWQSGGHHMEVGCGIGNALFGILLTYPQVTSVGIEIDELTAEETRRRADILGLNDRVEIRIMDACELQDENCFDTVQWSQFFFPASTRLTVLNAMHRALKPGGYLVMPLLDSPSKDSNSRRGEIFSIAMRALKKGSLSSISFLNDILRDSRRRRSVEQKFSSLEKILFHRWGVPVRSVDELKAEVEANGFRVVRSLTTPVNQFLMTRGLLLAQRE